MPERPRRCNRERHRRLAADDVEHDVGAEAAGQVHDLRGSLLAGLDGVLRPRRRCELQRRRAGVDRDHRRRAQRSEQLHRHVAESAHPDDDHGRPRHHQVQRPLDRVVRRQAGVGERRCLHGIEVAERHEMTRVLDQQQRRHAAVGAQPRSHRGQLRQVRAVVLHPLEAPHAATTPSGAVHRDGLADLEPGHAVTERLDPPRVLVAQGEGRLEGHHPGLEVVDQVQVRVAHARAGDPDEHLPGAGVGLLDAADLGILLPSGQLHGVHRELLVVRW